LRLDSFNLLPSRTWSAAPASQYDLPEWFNLLSYGVSVRCPSSGFLVPVAAVALLLLIGMELLKAPDQGVHPTTRSRARASSLLPPVHGCAHPSLQGPLLSVSALVVGQGCWYDRLHVLALEGRCQSPGRRSVTVAVRSPAARGLLLVSTEVCGAYDSNAYQRRQNASPECPQPFSFVCVLDRCRGSGVVALHAALGKTQRKCAECA
jgi:hypothetical protein